MQGCTGQDLISFGPYTVETRLGLITSCNKQICKRVDGILGFGWQDTPGSPSLFKTLTQSARSEWEIEQPYEFQPMPRFFAMAVNEWKAEIQLGDYDPSSVSGPVAWLPMKGIDYGVQVASISYGDGSDAVELLSFTNKDRKLGYIGKFDSGTTCILMPNTTVGKQLEFSPFEKLLHMQLKGIKRSLYFTIIDEDGAPRKFEIEYEGCVEPSEERLILGDPWFRKFVVMHDLRKMDKPRMGLAVRSADYTLKDEIDEDYLGAFSYDKDVDKLRAAVTPTTSLKSSRGQKKFLKHLRQAVREEKRRLSHNQVYKLSASRGYLPKPSPSSSSTLSFLEPEYRWEEEDRLEKVRMETNKIVYAIDIGVGTPPQKRRLIFDTGSYMLAVFAAPASCSSDDVISSMQVKLKRDLRLSS
ncbi:hypothetical protein GUITHDRAFT_121265 [Guillardia theta CCMP2712]|uniref:Peptidase A1 domain-containing protein n=1 Tax=Guillardia theta (strain CCMP2712) TaxID=905079 RepID=L1I8F9_GUITC|nr:hypothetical protein GUITHDRAFT_121265 [Guillardia theta CCMP2712]EKX32556.1 hypothetical protein GUITHDRAFT_121265 [Guillardia theta CCMP2712]|eukprot:XP_005819536.1 hypothetical protein GUITHDRAFT_121265 [Guillardia theta CCMP2712]